MSVDSFSVDSFVRGRCDVVAVVRDCVEAQEPLLGSLGMEVGIELPCGGVPWLWLDERRLRRLLDEALGGAVRRAGAGCIQLALWREQAPDGPLRLRVEAYAADPAVGASLEFDVAGGELPKAELPMAGRALVIEEHPARRRILQAQLVRLGMACDVADPGAPIGGAEIAGRYGFVWLGDASGIDRIALVSSLRMLERRRRHVRARIAGLCEEPPIGLAGIDAVLAWPLSLHQLRRLCVETAPDQRVAGMLFLREGREDAAAIRAALREGDWPAVVRHAHRIKGGTVVLGRNRICLLAERIETVASRDEPDPILMTELLAELEDRLRRNPV